MNSERERCPCGAPVADYEGREPQPEYVGLCGLCAWRKWAAPHAAEWDKVACIECELGRPCLKTPPCSGAEVDG